MFVLLYYLHRATPHSFSCAVVFHFDKYSACNSVKSSGNLISYPVKVAGMRDILVDIGYDTFYSVFNLFVVLYM
jgi:hypothetical protein